MMSILAIIGYLAIFSTVAGFSNWHTQPNVHIKQSSNSLLSNRSKHQLRRSSISPNSTVRYQRTTICETTEGVGSYSGYIDIGQQIHLFFWFFEARQSPETAPITLWLNGGPGSDSLVGLFTEVGPCTVNPDLTTSINPFSWSQVSNLLFLSQPIGVGFSYGAEGEGTFDGSKFSFRPVSI